jgi:hypothetical protein
MGLPTIPNYIVTAAIAGPALLELGVPLLVSHMFVFYFGIMADITPPVGLAAFAAAAISREDPIATGFQGALYSLRTAVLPFVFIFNPAMLLIGIENWVDGGIVIATNMVAVLLFSAATMNYFATRSRLWESAVLLVVCFALFRPDWWVNQVHPATVELPASELMNQVTNAPADQRLAFIVEGTTIEGEDVRKTVSLNLGEQKPTPQERLRAAGLTVAGLGDQMTISNVGFGSYAKRVGLEPGYNIVGVIQPAPGRPSSMWVYIPAFAVAGLIWWLQRRRARARTEKLSPVTV